MIDRMIVGYFRLGNWLFQRAKADPWLCRLPVVKWTATSLHLDAGHGDVLALFGSYAPETAGQRLLRRLWGLYPGMTDFAGGIADYHIWGWSLTYATARSTSYNSSDTTYVTVGQQKYYNDYFGVYRSYLVFDTSAIPDDKTVTQVNLKLKIVGDFAQTDFDVQIVKQDWSAQSREDAFDGCLSGTADDAIWKNTSDEGDRISGNLSTAWVNRTGSTYYSLRSSRDLAADEPTTTGTTEYVDLASASHATVDYRPLLIVRYRGPGRNQVVFVG